MAPRFSDRGAEAGGRVNEVSIWSLESLCGFSFYLRPRVFLIFNAITGAWE